MTDLYFAQLSDIHISDQGDQFDMLSGQAADFLSQVVEHLNRIEELDFVLITGDLLTAGSWPELELFEEAIRPLQKPYYIIPGNHDRRDPDRQQGLTRHDFARRFNPQVEARPTNSDAQAGYWSISLRPDIQLVGLDSVRDEDWGGIIDAAQVEWLKGELAAHADKLVLLAVHHPFHMLAPIDRDPRWSNFVCDNGGQILALLDQYPRVKMVLTGHHHLARADMFGRRLHLACPAMAIYPCAYRTVHLARPYNHQWHVTWQTHPAVDEETVALARQRMLTAWTEQAGLEPDTVHTYARLLRGNADDRSGKVVL